MEIHWHTRSKRLFQSISNLRLSQRANGGNAYDFAAAQALRSKYDVRVQSKAVQLIDENFLGYLLRYRRVRHSEDAIHILEPYPIAFGSLIGRASRIGIIHHIDTKAAKESLKHRLFFFLLMRQLRKMDVVVTVSKLWRDYLLKNGCRTVEIIYNSFNAKDYNFTADELRMFKTELGLISGRRLIYIGNAGNGKGVHKVYKELKDTGYEMVMTGAKNDAEDLPIKYFNLESLEYRKLIASCDVVLAMSNMVEGWNRIAHEAMLSKVPVIGSGSGGMRELLQNGQQVICSDFSKLKSELEYVLSNKEELGMRGHAFVERLNEEYFRNAWLEIIEKVKTQGKS